MSQIPNELCKKWRHSFEEDRDGLIVYRPESFTFPPARGRSGIEFRHDGTFIKTNIGSTDIIKDYKSQWQIINPHNLKVSIGKDEQNLEIIECKSDLLKIRKNAI